MEINGDGNCDRGVDGNGQQWRWMAMEMVMDKRTAMDGNGDGFQQWTETAIDSNGNGGA